MWKTLKETSEILGVSRRTIFRWIKSGKLRSEIGGAISGVYGNIRLIDEESIMKFLKEKANKAGGLGKSDVPIDTDTKVRIDSALGVENIETMEPIMKSYVFSTTAHELDPAWNKARTIDRERALAKFEIIRTYLMMKMEQKAKGINFSKTGESFVKNLANGLVCFEAFKTLGCKQFKLATLQSWETKIRASSDMDSPVCMLENLRYCGRKSKIDAQLLNEIRKLAIDKRGLTSQFIYEALSYKCEMFDTIIPVSERRIQALVCKFRKDVYGVSQSQGKTAFRNKVKLHNVRINDLIAGDLWESDGHECSFRVLSPFYAHWDIGKRFLIKPKIIAWFDVSTGAIVGYRACLTENKTAVRNSLMDAISIFGIPKQIRMDNGSAYTTVEHAPMPIYKKAQGKKTKTATQKIANQMIDNGDYGLYGNLGIEYHFTIPGNPESKAIEPAWSYVLGDFEKWLGGQISICKEEYQGLETRVILSKHKDKFFSWESFCDLLDKYVTYYNTTPRYSNKTLTGERLSPLQAYKQADPIVPDILYLQTKMRDPYMEMRLVKNSFIEKNGIFYWHPAFASLIGEKIGIFYDEKTLQEITICNERGQIYPEKAIAINPGLQSGDDLTELIENTRREKISKLFYLAHCNTVGVAKTEKMLKLICKELLPLSKSKQVFDYVYDMGSSEIIPQWAEGIDSRKSKNVFPDDSAQIQKMLFEKAKAESMNSYSPISGLRIGVALLCANNSIYTACHVESATTVCAERVAILKAITSNAREFIALAIYKESDILHPPCATCRQMMLEFTDDLLVIYGNSEKQIVRYLSEIEQ
jgi:cytidine deaminase